MAQRFGRVVGGKGYALLTGGGRGLPRLAERAAREQGGETWAVSAARTVDDQLENVFDASSTSVLYPTGSGGGPGAIEREAPLVQLANVRTYWNGRSGTFGELMAGLHEPGVIALVSRSGGVGGYAGDYILPYVGVPETVRVVKSRDPDRLLAKADAALADLHRAGIKTEPRAALYRTRPHRSVVTAEQRSKRVIMSFLVDDGGRAVEGDLQKTERLIDLALRARIKGKAGLPISRDNALAKQAFLAGGQGGVLVSHEGGKDERLQTGGRKDSTLLVRRTGKGPGVGEFASHREVVEHADVIFVTSAYFKNLSGLAFALRASKPPVIAVLELESTGSRHIANMSKLMEGEDRFVFDSDPARLIEKAAAKLTEKKPEEKPDVKKEETKK
jgi:hypothetical protein